MIDVASVPVSTPHTCPVCGRRATKPRTTTEHGVTTAHCMCSRRHVWVTKWLTDSEGAA